MNPPEFISTEPCVLHPLPPDAWQGRWAIEGGRWTDWKESTEAACREAKAQYPDTYECRALYASVSAAQTAAGPRPGLKPQRNHEAAEYRKLPRAEGRSAQIRSTA